MDQLDILTKENGALKAHLEAVNAEKLAIDEYYLIKLKEEIQLRSRIILLSEHIRKNDEEIHDLKSRINCLLVEINELKPLVVDNVVEL